jgi:hypothetical protein
LKSDHRLDRCWLRGQLGDALHVVLCAAGYNLRWLLRAMARRACPLFFCARFCPAFGQGWCSSITGYTTWRAVRHSDTGIQYNYEFRRTD